jgi:hypothetical protein
MTEDLGDDSSETMALYRKGSEFLGDQNGKTGW